MKKILIILVLAVLILNTGVCYVQADNDLLQKCYVIIYNHVAARSKLPAEWCDWITKIIIINSVKYKVDPLLITAKFSIESKFLPNAVSPVGAVGIAQLMPATARSMGFDPNDPAQNIEGGIKYFADQQATFNYAGDWSATFAVAAYNAGPGAVKEYNGVPPYAETQRHVQLVGDTYKALLAQLYHK